jgi:hypothetical protein
MGGKLPLDTCHRQDSDEHCTKAVQMQRADTNGTWTTVATGKRRFIVA